MRHAHPTVFFVIGLLFLLAVVAPPFGSVAEAATIVVDTLSDELNGNGNCSLREAITAANTNAPVDACPAGSGAAVDTITFSVSGTIVLGSVLPAITDAAGLTIDGGGTVTISGNGAVGVLVVNQCATLNLANITVANAARANAILNNGMLSLTSTTLASNVYTGSCCGGGIYTTGPLTVTDSAFSGNRPNAIYTAANLARGDYTTAPVNIAGRAPSPATGAASRPWGRRSTS